jgi:hypothetical protein
MTKEGNAISDTAAGPDRNGPPNGTPTIPNRDGATSATVAGTHPRGPTGEAAASDRPAASAAAFDRLADVMVASDRFGHRQHVELTWRAVCRYGTVAAITLISDGIRRTARYAGNPQKYHATVSRAWVEIVGHHATVGDEDFDTFVGRHPEVLDKRLLTRHYRSSTLATTEARTGWVAPDLEPLPGPEPLPLRRAVNV